MNDEQEAFVYAVQDHLNTYIRVADRKASILLTAQLAFLGLFSNALRTLFPGTGLVFQALAILSAGAGVAGIFLAGWVVYPRTQPPDADEGFFFWDDILAHTTAADYGEALTGLETDGVHDELTSENYTLAEVAQEKYHYLRWSLRATAVMIILACISGGIYLF
ncbi:Pycsar system effector family protein [Halogranum rubrum]|uniref:Pycsar effector protein domain-containing protein n=1 Tax=Halogranum salarium B-1 TaxID=1210908 RepID=J3JCT8_9EURY|nr:Pycsar system effector family protein [Halogranum salarium]EJN56901.1 hypothetical protein HSB1_47180 [Halogranum salarium B-1]